LSGFEFRVDPSARLADKRLLLAAAERRLGDELDRRAKSLVEAPDELFTLVADKDGAAIAWDGHRLARLAPGRSLLEPALRTARALDRLSADVRSALRAHLEGWLERQVAHHLQPLSRLASAATDRASSPGVRSVAAMLVDSGGLLPRKSLTSAIGSLEQADRQALHRLKVRLGPLDVFVPQLLKPAAQFWRGAMISVRAGRPMPALPAAGAGVLAQGADQAGAALAYRRLGDQWIRVDLADRLASHAHRVRAAGGDDPVDRALVTSIALEEEGVTRLMQEVGFARSGETWKWRGRRRGPQREDRRAGNAFAGLAELKR
jgi:ATP-dependent RNA helicase SUPV3L1/SUV3